MMPCICLSVRGQMPATYEGELTLEKTPSYFVTKTVPSRLYNMLADVRLIVVVRDPVTRAVSDYTQVRENLIIPETLHSISHWHENEYEHNYYFLLCVSSLTLYHCLHHLLPSERDTGHELRRRGHSYQLACYNFSSTRRCCVIHYVVWFTVGLNICVCQMQLNLLTYLHTYSYSIVQV